MKRILTLAAALTLITTLTGCGSGAQSESALDTTSQTATEVDDDNATQKIDPFEGVYIDPINEYYPREIDFHLNTDELPYYQGYTSIVYNGTLLSADTEKMTLEISVDIDKSQPYLDANNYEIIQDKKVFDVPIEQMRSLIIRKDQLELYKSDILKKADAAVDDYLKMLKKENVTYQLKECIALLPPDNSVFVEKFPLIQESGKPQINPLELRSNVLVKVPNPNLFLSFECSDGTVCIAFGSPVINEGSFSGDLYGAELFSNGMPVFSVAMQSSYEAAVEFINNKISELTADCTFDKIDFSVD